MKATYVRLFTDEAGESHLEDLDVTLEPQDFAPPAAPLHVASFLPAVGSMWVGAQPGWGGETPHPTPRRQIFCVLRGTFEVTASDGSKRLFPPGAVLLLEDTTGAGHSTRIVGDEEALFFAVTLE
jgi:hypothetical protein